MAGKILLIIGLLSALLLPSLVSAANDNVTISVNVSESAMIEVSPDIATFNQVLPGVIAFPGSDSSTSSKSFTITNVGSVNFTQMYVEVDITAGETSNPLGTGDPSQYYAGGFVVLKNESDVDNWRFVGRQEWNLTEKPEPYIGHENASAMAWGYFGNNSKQYFWELSNGTVGSGDGEYCNGTGTILRIKEWAVNGTAAAYDLYTTAADTITYEIDTNKADWGIFNAETSGPLANYCVATDKDCDRLYIYQWKQTNSQFDACTSTWYIFNEGEDKFNPDDQFDFNITVWVPKGIPAGDMSSSILTVTAA